MGEGGIESTFEAGHLIVMSGSLIHLRPRQVRYQAALRPDICCSFDSKTLSQALSDPEGHESGRTVPKLCQNPISSPSLCQNRPGLVSTPVQLLQRLAFHLQLHL